MSPDTVSVLVGGSTTFQGYPVDFGGDTVRTAVVHWRDDNFPPKLTVLDSSVANQVTVRLDSTPLGTAFVEAFVVRAPGDTLFGIGRINNPALLRITAGVSPYGIGVNPVTNQIYVGNTGGTDLTVIDGSTDAAGTPIHVGPAPNYIAVDQGLNKIYVTTDSAGASLAVVNGSTSTLLTTLDVGPTPQGLAIDQTTHRIYVAAMLNPGPHPVLIPIDATADTFLVADTVPLPSQGFGVVFNPTNGLVYVAHGNDSTVSVIDPNTHTIVQTIVVGVEPLNLAVDPGMNLVYVTLQGAGGVAIIQASTGSVTAFVPIAIAVDGIDVDPNLHRVYVGSDATQYLGVFDNGPQGLQPAILLPVGLSYTDPPRRVAYNPATGRVYAPMLATGVVTRLRY